MSQVQALRESREALGWADLQFVVEGLAYGQRPMRAATREVVRKYGLRPRGPWILSLISNGARHPLELSKTLRVGRSLITAELERLVEAKLVETRPGQRDRRQVELSLTPEGETACEQVRTEMARIVARNLSVYSREEVRLFSRMLRDVRRLEDDEIMPA